MECSAVHVLKMSPNTGSTDGGSSFEYIVSAICVLLFFSLESSEFGRSECVSSAKESCIFVVTAFSERMRDAFMVGEEMRNHFSAQSTIVMCWLIGFVTLFAWNSTY